MPGRHARFPFALEDSLKLHLFRVTALVVLTGCAAYTREASSPQPRSKVAPGTVPTFEEEETGLTTTEQAVFVAEDYDGPRMTISFSYPPSTQPNGGGICFGIFNWALREEFGGDHPGSHEERCFANALTAASIRGIEMP